MALVDYGEARLSGFCKSEAPESRKSHDLWFGQLAFLNCAFCIVHYRCR
jgi:hypothetical protein